MKRKTNFRLKTLFLLSFSLVFTIALALNVNAEINCNITSATTLGNLSILNATFNVSADASTGNVSAFFEGRSVSTANSSFSFISNNTNTSNLRHVNLTLGNGIIAEDANDWEFRATCYLNASSSTITPSENVATSSVITGRTLDRGSIPAAATAVIPTGKNTSSRTHTFSGTVVGSQVTLCTLTFTSKNPGQSAYAMTHSGDTCTQAISNMAEGSFPYTITVSDGTNASVTAEQAFSIDLESSAGRKAKIFNVVGGGGRSQESIGRGLAIAQNTRAGEVSQGLANAQIQINQFIEKETQPKELTKTGIGLGTGVLVGVLVPTLIIPGVGLITAPILGGLIGAGIGVAI